MKYWTEYKGHNPDIKGKKKLIDNTIYSFDIETTSFLILNGEQIPAYYYLELTEVERKACKYQAFMYIWMFSINDQVYYGRTWEELKSFFQVIEEFVPCLKYVFVHNLSFEFQFLRSEFKVDNVMARKSRNLMSFDLEDYNFKFMCTLKMTNCKLEKLPSIYHLPVKKLTGSLEYSKIRNSKTVLTKKELSYCENDCLVIYYYIKEELKTYEKVNRIPITSTGHVRRELRSQVMKDFKYRGQVKTAINTNPHIYNLLVQAFMGGYTHANWIYAGEVLKDIDSWDFTSSYPYVLVTSKYPATEFKKCNIKRHTQMVKGFAYLLVVRFTNIKCKYYNNFISKSKCRNIRGAKYDNGRIIEAKELEMTLTDVDFKFLIDTYDGDYEILESYYSLYKYLPKKFINFVLDKYIIKTEYKGIEEKEVEYNLEKQKFNALYGMSVTNMIKDEVIYDNEFGWSEIKLTNEEIENMLFKEKKKSFLSFAYGVFVTAHARNNLLRNLIKLDNYVVYSDTDSLKLASGYDKSIILEYNEKVNKKIDFVCKTLGIDKYKYSPEDIKGNHHTLGVFEQDGHYSEFITQGAKKYAVNDNGKIKITVSGVPKSGAEGLKRLEDFQDDFVFDYKYTNKHLLIYNDDQDDFEVEDYQGNKEIIKAKTGACIVPTTYVLGKSQDYAELISENSSMRAVYIE